MGSRLEILWRQGIGQVSLHLRCGREKESFDRFLDESQKRILLRLLDPAIEKGDPALALHFRRSLSIASRTS